MGQIPTNTELSILAVLWAKGPSTVRQVHNALKGQHQTGYTTILKMMQLMVHKGILSRDESQRSHIYRPARSEEHTQTSLIGHLAEKAFGGSAAALAVRALSTQPADPAEILQIRELLDEMEKKP